MQLGEYILFNRVVLATIIVTVLITILFIDLNSWTCVHKTITGFECKSCGITRDFLSFLRFDFTKPINQYSLGLFLYCTFQFIYRIIIAIFGLNLFSKQTKDQNSIELIDSKEVDIKKVIISDVMITFLFGILVFLPFWI
jgi:hypothetical protein